MITVTFFDSGLFTAAWLPDGFGGLLDHIWIKANKVRKPKIGETWEVEISKTVGDIHFLRPIKQVK